MNARVSKYTVRLLVAAFAALMPIAMVAQNSVKPAAKATSNEVDSKWDIFLGYSFLAPKGHVTYGANNNTLNYQNIDLGGIGSVSRYFTKNLGVQIEGDVHILKENYPVYTNTAWNETVNDFSGGSVGAIYRIPMGKITPFAHALIGGERAGIVVVANDAWGPVFTVGGGLDLQTPLFNKRLSVRVFQADYQYMREDLGNQANNINAIRLSGGLVYGIGSIAPPPTVTIACSASPASIFPGDPINLTATVGSVAPKQNVVYSWSGAGVTGTGASATVATAALAPGTYSVKCGVKEGKPGKEGLKPWQSAENTATFTVKPFEPPTISCVASPSTIKPGETSIITATGLSPQNRPLTYTYTASAGSVSGNGATATFNSIGAPTGAASITCSVSDDKSQVASSNSSVTIVAPYVPPAPHTQALCSIGFDKDKLRATRVDNEAKACLDEVALSLQKQSDAKAVVVGSANAKEKAKSVKAAKAEAKKKHPKTVENAAAERAVNTKEYLVKDKGIDASRVSVATGTADGQKVDNYLVPAGATFGSDVQGTTSVDETAVKAVPRKPLPTKHHAKKAAK